MRARGPAALAAVVAVTVACAAAGARSARPVAAIIFAREGDLYAVAVDGSTTIRLTKTRGRESAPAVSADGRRVAFARGPFGRSGISTLTLADSRGSVFTVGADGSPAWAPDGTSLYFVRYRTNRFGAACGSVFRTATSGARIRRVTSAFTPDHPTGHSHEDPAVSPDGRRVAFSDWDACEGGTASPRLRVVDAAGRPTRDLARLRNNGYHPNPEHSSPAWSPDGRRLAFFNNANLHIANRDGSGERRVARRSGRGYEPPAWSPDGRWIAFTDGVALFVVRPDGSGRRRIARPSRDGYSIGGWLPSLTR